MTPPSAARKMAELFRLSTELCDKAKNKQPWDEADCEALANGVAALSLLVQDLILESKKPTREVPILPKRT